MSIRPPASPSGASAADPLGIGYPSTGIPSMVSGATAWATANRVTYQRFIAGGDMNSLRTRITASSGNVAAAAFTNSGEGHAARPTGGRLVTTGSIPCPAAGFDVAIALGSTVTVDKGDWLAFGADNTTVALYRYAATLAAITPLVSASGYEDVFPPPATPAVSGGAIIHPFFLGKVA